MQIRFDEFDQDDENRPIRTGRFTLNGREIAITLPQPKEVKGEAGSDAFRRELMQIRDALSAMIADPNGVAS